MGTRGRGKSAAELVYPLQERKTGRKIKERQTSDPNQSMSWMRGYLGHSLCHLQLSLLLKRPPREAVPRGDEVCPSSTRKERAWRRWEDQEREREAALARSQSPRRCDSALQCNHAGGLPRCSSSEVLEVLWKDNKVLVCLEVATG